MPKQVAKKTESKAKPAAKKPAVRPSTPPAKEAGERHLPSTRPPKKTSSRAAFEFAGSSVKAGSHKQFELPLAKLPTGVWSALSVVVVHGEHDGPTIWLSAAVHGDELSGVMIIDEVLRLIKPAELSGTILATPIVNSFGLISGSRYLPDRRDLNRCFPRSRRGSLGARIAKTFAEQIVGRADYGIDFHTGSGGRTNFPQIRCDISDRKTRTLAKAFGAPVVLDSQVRDGSLRMHAVGMGKRVLLYEAGEAMRLDWGSIEGGISGTQRVMHKLGMLPVAPAPMAKKTIELRDSVWCRAPSSGFCRMEVTLGQKVKPRDVLATIFDPIGRKRRIMRAEQPGHVLGMFAQGLVNRGDALAHIGF